MTPSSMITRLAVRLAYDVAICWLLIAQHGAAILVGLRRSGLTARLGNHCWRCAASSIVARPHFLNHAITVDNFSARFCWSPDSMRSPRRRLAGMR